MDAIKPIVDSSIKIPLKLSREIKLPKIRVEKLKRVNKPIVDSKPYIVETVA